MSKSLTLAAFITSFFKGSDKTISEKLTTEEYATFGAEMQELHERINAQETGNAAVVADLATANASVATLTEQLATANGQITSLTSERDKYKAHYEKSASKGDLNPDTDENSKPKGSTSCYNAHAMDVWQKANS